MSLGLGRNQLGLVLGVLSAIQRPLFEGTASLDQQLAALGQRCGRDSGSSAGSNLPSAAQLQMAWAALTTVLALSGLPRGIPGVSEAELAAFGEEAARKLYALQPDSPRSSYEMGSALRAAMVITAAGSASRLPDPLPHFQRGAELARAQGSDFWLARWAGCGAWTIAGRRAWRSI